MGDRLGTPGVVVIFCLPGDFVLIIIDDDDNNNSNKKIIIIFCEEKLSISPALRFPVHKRGNLTLGLTLK